MRTLLVALLSAALCACGTFKGTVDFDVNTSKKEQPHEG